ncbi:MAG: prepilin-type N-terminal cleavage/methylation domain-containing protein [Desulfurivibrio sp.]|jgi:type IV pilus assembly protein PilW|nr:MAG: prepilin-type N-terminal cleavage/methylation domain-containing protein [Desulfurivibrio sp.]
MRTHVEDMQRGFTLIELLITMLISGIVIASIYSAFQSQQNSYTAQDQVAEMQQNIRAGLDMMTREIKMAGYDSTGKAGAALLAITASSINFSMDLNEDDDVVDSGENITYALDTVEKEITRNTQPIAQNIEELEFVYLDEDDAVTADVEEVRSVVISILARAGGSDANFLNSKQYASFSGTIWGPYNDYLRRRLLIQRVNCRNMGL